MDINNSFSFKLPQKTDLKATVGFNFFKNQYSKNRFPEELSLFYDGPDQDAGLYSFLGRFKGDKGIFPQKINHIGAVIQLINAFFQGSIKIERIEFLLA